MYSIRMNIDTQMIEILKDTYVEYEVPYADWGLFTGVVTTAYNHPGTLRKVRNTIPVTLGPPKPAFK
jgi:hypothetical protein